MDVPHTLFVFNVIVYVWGLPVLLVYETSPGISPTPVEGVPPGNSHVYVGEMVSLQELVVMIEGIITASSQESGIESNMEIGRLAIVTA